MLRTSYTSQAIDDALAGSFPASDPPAWTAGIARPAPELATRPAVTGAVQRETNPNHASDVVDVSRATDSERTFAQLLESPSGSLR